MRTRFAPSPTGLLHVGGARTALFCWLYARHYGGSFILRIEDTDRERSTEASVNAILDGMAWLGLDYGEGPFYQTQRMALYQEKVDRLLKEGKAYHCYCTRERTEALREEQRAKGIKPRYDGRCQECSRPPAGAPARSSSIHRKPSRRDALVAVATAVASAVTVTETMTLTLTCHCPDQMIDDAVLNVVCNGSSSG